MRQFYEWKSFFACHDWRWVKITGNLYTLLWWAPTIPSLFSKWENTKYTQRHNQVLQVLSKTLCRDWHQAHFRLSHHQTHFQWPQHQFKLSSNSGQSGGAISASRMTIKENVIAVEPLTATREDQAICQLVLCCFSGRRVNSKGELKKFAEKTAEESYGLPVKWRWIKQGEKEKTAILSLSNI